MKDTSNTTPEAWGREISSPMKIGNLFQVVKKKWRWFFFSIIICVCIALLYLCSTPNIYLRKASVLIKDEKAGATAGEAALYQELTQANVANNTSNEILIFQSYSLMAETIRRLNLDVNYQMSGIKSSNLYKKAPILVYFVDEKLEHTFSLKLKILDQRRVQLSGVVNGKKHSVIIYLNDTVETPFGKLVAVPTSTFDDGTDWTGKTIVVSKKNFNDIVEYYSQVLSVVLADKQSTVINLSLKDASATRAEDILNTLISVYNEDAINDKNQISINTENFINDRLEIIQQELGGVDQQIEEYKRENRLTDINSNAQIYLEENRDYSRSGVNIRNQYSMAIYIKRYLVDPSKTNQLIPANTGIQDAGIESQIEAYNTRLLKRNRLVESGSDKNPVVQDLTTALQAERQNIIRAVDNLIVNLNIQLNNAKSKEQVALENIASVPQQQKEVVSISRQQKIKEELYLFLLNKREENAINKAITENPLRVIDAATGPKKPVAPKGRMVLLIAVLLGLLIPICILYLMMLVDVYVRKKQDLIYLSIPFLGEIPQEKNTSIKRFFSIKKKKRSLENAKVGIAVQENSRDAQSEAFRIIRTNMSLMHSDKPDLKVLMTTSSNSYVGKSFVALNLSLSLALAGKKVLLMDLDTYKGSLTTSFNKSVDDLGLMNYLLGQVSVVDSIINRSLFHSNVDVILSGPILSNSSEILLGQRFDDLITELRSRYDYIVLDSVTEGQSSDCVIANRVVDLTLFVVGAGVTHKHLLPEIEQLYKSNRLKNMALILNGTEVVRNDDK